MDTAGPFVCHYCGKRVPLRDAVGFYRDDSPGGEAVTGHKKCRESARSAMEDVAYLQARSALLGLADVTDTWNVQYSGNPPSVTCDKCGREIGPRETVFIEYTRGPAKRLCDGCHIETPRYGSWRSPRDCICGRPIRRLVANSWQRPAPAECSRICHRRRYRSEVARNRADRICVTCGGAFPGRAGALTCSPKCRQSAYRARRADR